MDRFDWMGAPAVGELGRILRSESKAEEVLGVVSMTLGVSQRGREDRHEAVNRKKKKPRIERSATKGVDMRPTRASDTCGSVTARLDFGAVQRISLYR